MIVCGTGHRPQKLGLDYSEKSDKILRDFLTNQLYVYNKICYDRAEYDGDADQKITELISGGATGFDIAFAEAAFTLEIPFTLALPFQNFGGNWPKAGQDRLEKLIKAAKRVHYVTNAPYTNPKMYIDRDHWMVDNSNMTIALWDGTKKSGTGATVVYSEKRGHEIFNLWDKWVSK